MFPNLAKELEQGVGTIKINALKLNNKEKENSEAKTFRGYNPEVIDFLKRCDTLEEAYAIVDYLEKHKEISTKYAHKLRRQLKEKGIRSFGVKKDDGYYSLKG